MSALAMADARYRGRPRPRPLVERVAGAMSVSTFTTLLSLAMLAVLTSGIGLVAWIANIIATGVGTGPSYVLNRRFVWRRRDTSDPWREVAPFCGLSFAGLALSTLAVGAADAWCRDAGLSGTTRTLALLAANVTAFGLLWIVQFIVLDRLLFTTREDPS